MLFRLIEVILIVVGIVFVFNQMIFPAVLKRPLFSWFRKSEAKVKEELAEALQQYDEAEIKSQTKAVKKATSKLK